MGSRPSKASNPSAWSKETGHKAANATLISVDKSYQKLSSEPKRVTAGVQFADFYGDVAAFTATSVRLTRWTQPISSKAIAIWTQQEALRKYGLGTDNCIHFVFNFGLNFLRHGNDDTYNNKEGAFLKFARKAREKVKELMDTIDVASS